MGKAYADGKGRFRITLRVFILMFALPKMAEPEDLTVRIQNNSMDDPTELHVPLFAGCYRLPRQ